MSYQNEKNIAGETEDLSSDEQNVSRLLLNLKRVDAPKDFDFHLKARIANASPAQYRPVRFFPVLKYALPLALFLLVGAAFVLTNSYSGGSNVPAVADVRETPVLAPITDPPSGQKTGEENFQPPVSNVQLAGIPQNEKRKFGTESQKEPGPFRSVRPRAPDTSTSRGGSIDLSGGDKRGNANVASVLKLGNSNSTQSPDIPLQFRQIFMSIGIDASDAGEKTWKVMKLAKDSVAERSGIRVGDLMEAIDDKPIDPLYKGSFSVKSITVRRDDKIVKIDLHTSP